MMKVGIVGSGMVGSTAAYSMVLLGVRRAAYEIIAGKGVAYYGIGCALQKSAQVICTAIDSLGRYDVESANE